MQALGSDAVGWLYQGMTERLCLDMGLNLDPNSLGNGYKVTDEEAQLRRQIY